MTVGMKEPDKVPVMAAGGIVVREQARQQLIGIVRLRKNRSWVLPKGKLKPGESARDAARREVLEETGHQVSVHEFLGAMSHSRDGKHKVVQFWRMSVVGGPVRALMDDVKAVKWLPLEQAIKTLTHAHEQAFLTHVGPTALKAALQSAPDAQATGTSDSAAVGPLPARGTFIEMMLAWFRRMMRRRATHA
jgi:8-oxo-dGTP diphosphatase